MEIKNYLYAIVIVGIVILCASGLLGELGHDYGVPTNTSFATTYNTINAMKNTSQGLQNTINGNSIAPGSIFGFIIYGIGSFFKLIFQALTLPITMLFTFCHDYGIPSFFPTSLLIMITIGVTFAVVRAATKTDV